MSNENLDTGEDEALEVAESAPATLIEIMDSFRNAQRTVLRLADFIVERKAEIDNRREHILRATHAEFPEVDDDVILSIVDGFDSIAERASELSRDSEPDFDQMVEDIEQSVGAVMRTLPEDYRTPEFIASVARAQAQPPSMPLLIESLLVNLVGSFELVVGALARFLYSRHPAALEASERSFTWKELASHDSLESFQSHVIERAVDEMMRDSAEAWMKIFSSKFKVKIPDVASDLRFREVLQRRHLVVHNGGRVSRLYLSNLDDMEAKPNIGDRLTVDEKYLRAAADQLAGLGLGLAGQVGRKVLKGDEREDLDSFLANLPYRLLQDGRFAVSLALTREFPSASYSNEYRGLVTRVNGWLSLKRLGRFEECRAEVESWQTDALRPVFRLARFALLDEMESGYQLVQVLRGTTELSTSFWLTWPLLAELREYEKERLLQAEQAPAPGAEEAAQVPTPGSAEAEQRSTQSDEE